MTKYLNILKEIKSILNESDEKEDKFRGSRRVNLQRLVVQERLDVLLDLVNNKIDELEEENGFYMRMADI